MAHVNPDLQKLFDSAELFEDWPQAIDAAVERDRPVIARVGSEIAKCFPSRNAQTLFPGERK